MSPLRALGVILLVTVTGVGCCTAQWQRGEATQWLRLTSDGRSVTGEFSPDYTSVAIVSLQPATTAAGDLYYERSLNLWVDGSIRNIAGLPDSDADHGFVSPPAPRLRWLPSGRHLLLREYADSGREHLWLVRTSDGARTTVGRVKRWFVLNNDWELPNQDAVALRDMLHPSHTHESRDIEFADLPASVPHQSEDWTYLQFRRSPSDHDLAMYVAHERDFDGCSCTMYLCRRYLGVVDLRSGRMRRLTWGDDHTIRHPTWTPDGSALVYQRDRYEKGEHGSSKLAGSDLHVIRRDGTGDRHVLADVAYYGWRDDGRVLVSVGPNAAPDDDGWRPRYPRQLGFLDIHTGRVQWLTKGPFVHEILEEHDGIFLVREIPVGEDISRGDLYLIRPL